MEIAFIILNYNTFEETVDCIKSIEEKIDTTDFKIVVVDNGSKDDSAKKISEFVVNKDYAELISTNRNVGFARGNNLGIRYVNKKYKPKYVVVLNSDTELIQYDLLFKLNKEYENSEFALLGPLILNANGKCDNSPHISPIKEQINRELEIFRKERVYIQLGLYRAYCGIRHFKNLFTQRILHIPAPLHRNLEFHQYQKQVVLQGCFVVFSQRAFEHIEGFDESTFLYYEEAILYLHLIHHGLITVYDPEICIYHKDGCSTNKVHSTTKEKLLFINMCYQDSAKALLRVIKEYK